MIDRAYLQVLADDVRPGWRISGPFGIATVSSVHHTVSGIDIAYRPFPRTSGNSLHFRPQPDEVVTRLADDDILDRIELLLLEAIDGADDSAITVNGSTLYVAVDGVTWALPLRSARSMPDVVTGPAEQIPGIREVSLTD